MAEKMKAIVYNGKGHPEAAVSTVVQEIPEPGKGEILIKIEYAGICGSDLSIVEHKHPRALPGTVLGHEFSGRIADIGPGTETSLAKGDLVVAEPLISCGKCYACVSGYAYVCQTLGLYGIDSPGGFAEYVKIPAEKVLKVPEHVPADVAALIEPTAVAVHAVRLSSLKVGDKVLVLGGGPIGMLTAIVAELAGADVRISEIQPYRVELAKALGLQVLDPASGDPLSEIQRWTMGRGADIVFEAAGAQATISLAAKACKVRGDYVQIAMPKDPREINIVDLTFKEVIFKGVRVYAPYDFERAVNIVAGGRFDFSRFLSKPFALDDAGAAFEKAKHPEGVMRVMFKAG